MRHITREKTLTHYHVESASFGMIKGSDRKLSRAVMTLPMGDSYVTLFISRDEASKALKKMRKTTEKSLR